MSRLSKLILSLAGLFLITSALVYFTKDSSSDSADLASESLAIVESQSEDQVDEKLVLEDETQDLVEEFQEVYFTDAFGNARQLSEFLGSKPLVLNIWASWCPPCRDEMPHFESMNDHYGNQIELLMINATGANGETKEKAMKFLTDEDLKLPVYYDQDFSAQLIFNARSIPLTVFMNPDGSIHHLHYGYLEEDQLNETIEQML